MKKIIRILEVSKVPNAETVFNKLLSAGIVTDEATAGNVAALLVAVSAPAGVDLLEYTIERLEAVEEKSFTFGETLRQMLTGQNDVSHVVICQNRPWAKIHFLTNNPLEFEIIDGTPCWIRTECIIPGAVIAAISSNIEKMEV